MHRGGDGSSVLVAGPVLQCFPIGRFWLGQQRRRLGPSDDARQHRRQLELDLHRGHEWSQERWSQEDRQDAVRDFRQRGASLGRHRHEFPFSVGCKDQAGLDIFRLQIRKIGENFLLCHAGSKIFEYVIDGDPEASNTRFPPSFSRFYRDAFSISHGFQFTRAIIRGQQWMHTCAHEKSV